MPIYAENARYAHFAEICEKCGNTNIRVKLTRLHSADPYPIRLPKNPPDDFIFFSACAINSLAFCSGSPMAGNNTNTVHVIR